MGCSVSMATVGVDSNGDLPRDKMSSNQPSGTLIFASKNDYEGRSKGIQHQYFGLNVNYNDIVRGERVGKGTYGCVYKAMLQGKCVALKELFIPIDTEGKKEMLIGFSRESEILSVLYHPNIMIFMGAVQDSENNHYCLITELCPGSVASLLKLAKKKTITLTWKILVNLAEGAARACDYLHKLEPQILHRDLKAENLLADEYLNCKLTDFGLSRSASLKEKLSAMTCCGSPSWVAPEIFRGDLYTEKIDVYSYGIVLWELFSMEKPHKNIKPMELPFLIVKRGLRPELMAYVPEYLNNLMEMCWNENDKGRPTFTEIIKYLKLCDEHFDLEDNVNKELIISDLNRSSKVHQISPESPASTASISSVSSEIGT